MLKICVLLDNMVVPKWEYEVIKGLLERPQVTISCCLLNTEEKGTPQATSALEKIYQSLNSSFVWTAYQFCTRKWLTESFQPRDLAFLKKETELIECAGIPVGKYRTRLPAPVLTQLKNYNLDIIIRFGFGILTGDIFKIPKMGVWSYHHDDLRKYRGGPPLVWQIYNGEEKIGATLQVINEELDKGYELVTGFYKPEMSYIQTREKIFSDSSRYVLNTVDKILAGKKIEALGQHPETYGKKIYKAPKNKEALVFVFRELMKQKQKIYDLFFDVKERWAIGGSLWTGEDMLDNRQAKEPDRFVFTHKDSDRDIFFVADPFLVHHNGLYHLFYEDCYANDKAKISLATSEDMRHWQFKGTVLEEKFHLSYPSIIKSGADFYMAPECHQSGEVRLYRAKSFPDSWEYAGPLISGEPFVDPTVFFHQDQWWMFVSCIPYQNEVLRLFYAKELLGPWREHPFSPVKRDPQFARMAGPVVSINGKLIRFAQDNIKTYGHQVYAFEIEKLSTQDYREKLLAPDPFLKPGTLFKNGMHHVCPCFVDGQYMTVMDGKNFEVIRRKPGEILKIIANKISREILH